MPSRPTLEEFGPIVATLPADWPKSGAKLPARKREFAARPVASLDELASDETAPKAPKSGAKATPSVPQSKAGEVPESFDDEAVMAEVGATDSDAPVGDEEAEAAAPVFSAPKGLAMTSLVVPVVPQTAQAQASAIAELTLADKLESVLDTLPNEIVQFIEEEMRARFVAVKAVAT